MRRRAVVAALAAASLAAGGPAVAEPLDGVPVVAGRVDGAPLAWLGCVRPASGPGRVDCVVATTVPGAPDASAVAVTVVSYAAAGAAVERTTLHRDSLRATSSNGLWNVRFVATLATLGEVDVTHQAHPTLAMTRVTDTCALVPLHVELAARTPVLSPVVKTAGTVAGVAVVNADSCASSLALGAVSGAWRAASGL